MKIKFPIMWTIRQLRNRVKLLVEFFEQFHLGIVQILSVVWCIPVMQNEIGSRVVKESQCLSNLNLIGHCVSYSSHVKQAGTSCVQFSTIFPG